MLPFDSVESYPLTQPQSRIHITQTFYPHSSMFTIGGMVLINGPLDKQLLHKAIAHFVQTHDAFHIRLFVGEDGQVYQYFLHNDEPAIEWKSFETETDFSDWLARQAVSVFPMYNQALYQFTLFQKENAVGYVIRLHHIIADGWSFQMLTEEIHENYLSFAGGDIFHGAPAISYKQFIRTENEYLQSKRYERDQLFWNARLGGSPEPFLQLSQADISGARYTCRLTSRHKREIVRVCQENNVSRGAFFIALYQLYQYIFIGKRNATIGVPVLGRLCRNERKIFGTFVNTLTFRMELEDETAVDEFLTVVDRRFKTDLLHQRYPYNHLIRDLKLGANSLYRDCVNYYNTTMCKRFAGYSVENVEFYNGEQAYDMQWIVRDWSDKEDIHLDIDYKTSLYSAEYVRDMGQNIVRLLDCILGWPEQKIRDLPLQVKNSHWEKMTAFHREGMHAVPDNTVVDMFRESVESFPQKTAVSDGNQNCTYAQLDQRSNAMAEFLRIRGLDVGDVVGILLDYTIDAVAAVIGILKAGCVYVPLDASWPHERMAYILQDTQVSLILTNRSACFLEETGFSVADIRDEKVFLEKPSRVVSPFPIDTAYIIYTSGSTGQPKGVVVSHRSLANYISFARRQYVRGPEDVFALYSPLSFDLTVTSLYTPLSCGSSIRLYRHDGREAHVLLRIMRENLCTVVKLTPAHLHFVSDADNRASTVRQLIVGGENLTTELAGKTLESFGGKVAIYNEYGPTEATVGCMIYRYDPMADIGSSVPIGRPIENLCIYVLDTHLDPLPMGEDGEIYIAGMGLAQGYVNHPLSTSQRFIRSDRWGCILYKTGDRARYIREDCIEYKGRTDDQIKINGYRIEPAEIENCMQKIPGLKRAVVVVHVLSSQMVLCGYYTADGPFPDSQIKQALAQYLPDYMIPPLFQYVEKIPLTSNGKVDKQALSLSQSMVAMAAPSTPTGVERILLDELCEVLGKPVTMEDHFLYAGGDSIRAIQLETRLHRKGYRLKTRDILQFPNLRDMACHLESDPQAGGTHAPCTGSVPFLPIHHWFFSQPIAHPEQYCQTMYLRLTSCWETDDLTQVLQSLLQKHDALRLRYLGCTDELQFDQHPQPICVEEYPLPDGLTSEEEKSVIRQHMYTLTQAFDMAVGPIMASALFRSKQGDDLWGICIHHLAVDSVSWFILLADLQTMLEGKRRMSSKPIGSSEKTQSIQVWAQAISRMDKPTQAECAYWRDVLSYDTSFPWVGQKAPTREAKNTVRFLPEQTTRNLCGYVNAILHLSMEELLIATLGVALGKCLPQSKVLLELEHNGRYEDVRDVDISRTVGWFTNVYPLAIPLQVGDLESYIGKIKDVLRSVPNHGRHYSQCVENPWQYITRAIRFNYLGRFTSKYSCFKAEPMEGIIDVQGRDILCVMEINSILYDDQLVVHLRSGYSSQQIPLERIAEKWMDQLLAFGKKCKDDFSQKVSPSDFSMRLTQGELDALFG